MSDERETDSILAALNAAIVALDKVSIPKLYSILPERDVLEVYAAKMLGRDILGEEYNPEARAPITKDVLDKERMAKATYQFYRKENRR